MSARVSGRLWQRLRAMGLSDECGVGLRSLRPSRASRANGAWSWAEVNGNGVPLALGSQWPMAELLAAKRLVASLDEEVYLYASKPKGFTLYVFCNAQIPSERLAERHMRQMLDAAMQGMTHRDIVDTFGQRASVIGRSLYAWPELRAQARALGSSWSR